MRVEAILKTALLGVAVAVAFAPTCGKAQGNEAVECVPQKLRPPAGAAARLKLVGTNDPIIVSNYRTGVIALFCEPLDAATGWALVGQAALAGYRPAVRLIAAQVPEDPSVLAGQEAEFFPVILKEARSGAASANNAAAYMKLKKVGTEYDPSGAAELFARSAGKGNQRGIENLAYMRAVGLGTDKSTNSAMALAATLPPPRATRAVARIIVGLAGGGSTSPDVEAIDAWAEKFSRLGELPSRLKMEFGDALESASGSAYESVLVEQAARFGVTEAMVRQAAALLRSNKAADEVSAVELLQKAALQGDRDAPRILARLAADYLSDSEVPRSAAAALRLAADAGNTSAMIAYANLLYFPNFATPSVNLGAQMLERAAQAGSAEAQQRYGVLRLLGVGVDADSDEALKWMRASADRGYPLAAIMLAQIGEEPQRAAAAPVATGSSPLTNEVAEEAGEAPAEP